MRKIILLLCAFTGLSFSCFSQAETSGTSPVFQKTDTIKAVEHLYRRKRTGGIVQTTVFAIAGSIMTAAVMNDNPTPGKPPATAGSQINGFLGIGVMVILTFDGISKISRYNKKNLEKRITAYQNGKRLPSSIRTKLRKRDFR